MSRHPMNLSSLLTVTARGRGATGRAASTAHAPPPPRRNRGALPSPIRLLRGLTLFTKLVMLIETNVPETKTPGMPPRRPQRRFSKPLSPSTQVLPQTWAPQLIRGDGLLLTLGTVRVPLKPYQPLLRAYCCLWLCKRSLGLCQIGWYPLV